MAIYKLLERSALPPERVRVLTAAYEATLERLHLTDRNDPVTEIVATTILDVAQTQNGDPIQISKAAIQRLGIPNAK